MSVLIEKQIPLIKRSGGKVIPTLPPLINALDTNLKNICK